MRRGITARWLVAGALVVTTVACSSGRKAIPLAPVATTIATTTTTVAPTTTTTTTVAPSTTLPPLTAANAPLVTWNGSQRYIHGANLPWVNFGRDFGGGPADGGASSADSERIVGAALQSARAAGMNVVRWWLFPGDPTLNAFTVDAEGLPTGLRDTVYQDIDAALAMAATNRLAYTFTLFSGPTSMPATWRTTQAGRDKLALVLAGLFAHYETSPQIMTWDIVNEPEFDVWDHKVVLEDLRALISTITTAAHTSTPVPVTVGGARLDGLPILLGLGLDYYTIHWYDPMTEVAQCLACATYVAVNDAYHVDRPIVVGEFYVPPGDGVRFALWRDHGYAGALAWSLLPDHTADHFTIDMDAAATFASAIGLD